MEKNILEYEEKPMANLNHIHGYQKFCAKRTILDYQELPFFSKNYGLCQESEWGSSGGIGKDVVIYEIMSEDIVERCREIITHQFDRNKDQMNNCRIEYIQVSIELGIVEMAPQKYFVPDEEKNKLIEKLREGFVFQEAMAHVHASAKPPSAELVLRHTKESVHNKGFFISRRERGVDEVLREEKLNLKIASNEEVRSHIRNFGILDKTIEKTKYSYCLY